MRTIIYLSIIFFIQLYFYPIKITQIYNTENGILYIMIFLIFLIMDITVIFKK